jgi:esterase/lipase
MFIGVSLGGMFCSELADILKPEKIIIISSAKCRDELPGLYKFQKYVPINKIVPKRMVKIGAQILQPLVEPDRKKNKSVFKNMLKNKSPDYYKASANMIVNWDKTEYNHSIIHIHGSKDNTLPFRRIQADYILPEGSHMMTLTRGEELNSLIMSIITCQ